MKISEKSTPPNVRNTHSSVIGSKIDPQQSQNDANFRKCLREKAATRGGQRVHCIYQSVLPTPHDSNPASGLRFVAESHGGGCGWNQWNAPTNAVAVAPGAVLRNLGLRCRGQSWCSQRGSQRPCVVWSRDHHCRRRWTNGNTRTEGAAAGAFGHHLAVVTAAGLASSGLPLSRACVGCELVALHQLCRVSSIQW
eukprot:COSAG02_NODE_487_length_21276_cov_36.093167_8_plen_195_part_00